LQGWNTSARVFHYVRHTPLVADLITEERRTNVRRTGWKARLRRRRKGAGWTDAFHYRRNFVGLARLNGAAVANQLCRMTLAPSLPSLFHG
jgi:hypothetical protein